MKVAAIERGEELTDIKTGVTEYEGTMKDFYKMALSEVEEPELRLLEHTFTEDEEVIIHYYSEIDNKHVTFYAFEVKE